MEKDLPIDTQKLRGALAEIRAEEGEAPREKIPMQGNFPVDLHAVDVTDPLTGEVLYTARVSSQMRFLDTKGRELPDPRPLAPALGTKAQMPIRDYIRSLVHSEALQRELDAQGAETFEEADDFEVGDDYFPDSQYENELDPPIAELIRAGNASLSAKAAAEAVRKAADRGTLTDAPNTSQPEKSPRRPRKGPAVDPEGSTDGDLD